MSAHAFAGLRSAPLHQYLPPCRYGCGEMLVLSDGYQCPICGYYRSPDVNHPARRRSFPLNDTILSHWVELWFVPGADTKSGCPVLL